METLRVSVHPTKKEGKKKKIDLKIRKENIGKEKDRKAKERIKHIVLAAVPLKLIIVELGTLKVMRSTWNYRDGKM